MDLRRPDNVLKDQIIINLYKMLEEILRSNDYMGDVREVLKTTHPNYLEMLKKRREDMQKSDHGVVFAGETSAGKSTLINKVLGKKIFKPNTHESTATICKIRNSVEIKIVAEHLSGETSIIHLPDTCELETETGEKMFRETLGYYVDKPELGEGIQYRSIDIGFPIEMLKGNTIFVDTPGIGGSTEKTKQLFEYLGNALSFVFVINVGSAGGLLKDRLPKILKTITDLQEKNEMPCFDPKEVIFVTNKWDTLFNEEDEDNQDEIDRTWNTLKAQLRKEWPSAKEQNIFQFSLRNVSSTSLNASSEQFDKFKKQLEDTINTAKDARVIKHLRTTGPSSIKLGTKPP
uniref:Uncharacterized protein LOC111102128 n=1 Tax=Crassostrea virginica TaxID=6565 RepID=A0A8B8AG63_CRAVI|nr:uncharacterized protein LOC111102128 [Crassostrea virginica]